MKTHPFSKLPAAVVLAFAIALVGSGCARNNDDAAADAPTWDPCAAFPDTAMNDVGQNYKALKGGQVPGMRCSWVNASTAYSLDVEYRTKNYHVDWKSEAEDPAAITIGKYDGHVYHVKGNPHSFMCSVQVGTKNSSVVFQVTNQENKAEDPCAYATRIANALQGYLPPAQ